MKYRVVTRADGWYKIQFFDESCGGYWNFQDTAWTLFGAKYKIKKLIRRDKRRAAKGLVEGRVVYEVSDE